MLAELVIALVLVAVCAGGWLSAETELRRTYRALDVALGWEEPVEVRPTLSVVDGRDA